MLNCVCLCVHDIFLSMMLIIRFAISHYMGCLRMCTAFCRICFSCPFIFTFCLGMPWQANQAPAARSVAFGTEGRARSRATTLLSGAALVRTTPLPASARALRERTWVQPWLYAGGSQNLAWACTRMQGPWLGTKDGCFWYAFFA